MSIPVWEQLATDQTDPWQVVPRQVITPYDCLLISVAFVVLCRVDGLWVRNSSEWLNRDFGLATFRSFVCDKSTSLSFLLLMMCF